MHSTKTKPNKCDECKFYRARTLSHGYCPKLHGTTGAYDWCAQGRRRPVQTINDPAMRAMAEALGV